MPLPMPIELVLFAKRRSIRMHGYMTCNETGGTRVQASHLAGKLKSTGLWNSIVTDGIDDYIDSLVRADMSGMDTDDLLQEEFF